MTLNLQSQTLETRLNQAKNLNWEYFWKHYNNVLIKYGNAEAVLGIISSLDITTSDLLVNIARYIKNIGSESFTKHNSDGAAITIMNGILSRYLKHIEDEFIRLQVNQPSAAFLEKSDRAIIAKYKTELDDLAPKIASFSESNQALFQSLNMMQITPIATNVASKISTIDEILALTDSQEILSKLKDPKIIIPEDKASALQSVISSIYTDQNCEVISGYFEILDDQNNMHKHQFCKDIILELSKKITSAKSFSTLIPLYQKHSIKPTGMNLVDDTTLEELYEILTYNKDLLNITQVPQNKETNLGRDPKFILEYKISMIIDDGAFYNNIDFPTLQLLLSQKNDIIAAHAITHASDDIFASVENFHALSYNMKFLTIELQLLLYSKFYKIFDRDSLSIKQCFIDFYSNNKDELRKFIDTKEGKILNLKEALDSLEPQEEVLPLGVQEEVVVPVPSLETSNTENITSPKESGSWWYILYEFVSAVISSISTFVCDLLNIETSSSEHIKDVDMVGCDNNESIMREH